MQLTDVRKPASRDLTNKVKTRRTPERHPYDRFSSGLMLFLDGYPDPEEYREPIMVSHLFALDELTPYKHEKLKWIDENGGFGVHCVSSGYCDSGESQSFRQEIQIRIDRANGCTDDRLYPSGSSSWSRIEYQPRQTYPRALQKANDIRRFWPEYRTRLRTRTIKNELLEVVYHPDNMLYVTNCESL